MNWEHDSKLTDAEKLQINERISSDDTLREIYELAKKFYLPVYPESKYFLIEDTLKYQVCYAETNDSCTPTFNYSRSSKYFYPLKFDTDDPRILYLNSKYNQILADYFKNSENDIHKRGEIYAAKRKIFEEKIKFYSINLMGIKPDNFHKTHILVPEIWDIVINKDLNKAFLTYTTYYYRSFEESLWEKRNGIWEFIKIVGKGGY